jgi:transcriptional regulator with XRE-family HTH domain
MGQPLPPEGDSSIIVSLSEAAMHMYTAAIDALPFPEDKKFHKRADVVLSGMRKLRTALTDAASTSRPTPAVIAALSNVRRRYDTLMAHAATAPGSSLGQQLYVTRVEAKLTAHEVANGAGLSADLLDELEAGGTPTDEESAKIKDAIAALGGVPGTEHQEQQHHEPVQQEPEDHEPEQEEPADPDVNGWDESLVTENAG